MTVENLIPIAVPFLTILFLLLLGVLLRRRGPASPDLARQLTWLVLNVTLPPLIFLALATEITPAELARAPLLVAMGVVGPLAAYALAALIGRLPVFPPHRRSTLHAAVGMMNTTFIGYPVCEALLGSRGLLYAVLYDAGFSLLMSTWSIWLFSWGGRQGPGALGRSLRALARSPLMWGVLLGLAWGAWGPPLPVWVRGPLHTLGQATVPVALLAVGMLATSGVPEGAADPPDARPRGQLILLTLARLIVAPALIWGLTLVLRLDRAAAAVIVLQTAMPAAVATTAMAEQYGGDGPFAAEAVIVTTFLSLLTLPLWAWVLLGGSLAL